MISKSSVQLKVFENIKVDAFLSLKLSEVFVENFLLYKYKGGRNAFKHSTW